MTESLGHSHPCTRLFSSNGIMGAESRMGVIEAGEGRERNVSWEQNFPWKEGKFWRWMVKERHAAELCT